jgi:hypothetical protein
MIRSIQIQGYRGFERFEMRDLSRLNLLVGTNNGGKTSMLEAIYLLTSQGDPSVLFELLSRRGERFPAESGGPNLGTAPRQEFDISHLFTGHEIHVGSIFSISARNQGPGRSLTFSIAEQDSEEHDEPMDSEAGLLTPRQVLLIDGQPSPPVPALPLTSAGGISTRLPPPTRRRTFDVVSTKLVTTESLDGGDLVGLWDRVVLRPDHSLVLRALRFLDPGIEEIAAQSSQSYYGRYYRVPERGGFIVKRKGHDQPIPIGSMGDGMWRMMALAIAITQCKGGFLLVDEIDTGLHYSVMSDMWRLIFGAAKVLDVQVFATTHSLDCVQSLAALCTSDHDASNSVTLQRIEPGKSTAVPYTEREIRVAAERNIEVR